MTAPEPEAPITIPATETDAARVAELRVSALIERNAGTTVASTTVVIFLAMVALRTGASPASVGLWSVLAWGQIAASTVLGAQHRRNAGRRSSARWLQLLAVSALWAGSAVSVWCWLFMPWDDSLAVAIVLMALVAYWLGAAVCLAASTRAFCAFSGAALAGPVATLLLEGGDYRIIGLLSLPLAAAIGVVHLDLRGQVLAQISHREDLELLAAQQSLVFDSIAEAVLTLDQGRVGACNQRFLDLLGTTRDACVGRPVDQVLGASAHPGSMVPDGRPVAVRVTLPDGREAHLELRGQGIPNRDDHEVWLCADVTDRVQREREMQTLAAVDDLTGLMNRRAMNDRLRALFTRDPRPAGVLLVDLDGFKGVNDVYGHAVGDQVLKLMANRLRQAAGDRCVGRIGGDEFVVVVEHGDADEVERVAGAVVEVCRRPIDIGGNLVTLAASVGVADVSATIDPSSALRQADRAMYRAKEVGGDRFVHSSDTPDPGTLSGTPTHASGTVPGSPSMAASGPPAASAPSTPARR